jgi:hypothetical protein
MGVMRRGLKLGIGIPIVVLGFFVALAGGVLTALVGGDGRLELPENGARSDGHAIVFDALSLRGMATSGDLALTLNLRVRDDVGTHPIFVGVGPRADVDAYLGGVHTDRLIQVNWPGQVRTEPVNETSTRAPGPPADEGWWAASASGTSVSMDWVATSGDWTVVVMNADGSTPVDVRGSVAVGVPALGAASIVLLVLGLVIAAGGGWLTVAGARTPARPRPTGAPPRPDAAAAAPLSSSV